MRLYWVYLTTELKRFFRDKTALLMTFVFPIVLIFILSSAFSTAFSRDFKLDPFTVGYSVSAQSELGQAVPQATKLLQSEGITLAEMKKDDAFIQMSNGKIAGFVEFGDSGITYWKSKNLTVSASVFEAVLRNIIYTNTTVTAALTRFSPQETLVVVEDQSSRALVTVNTLEIGPVPDSKQYYAIAMVINSALFTAIAAFDLLQKDRWRRMNQRVALSNAQPATLFAGRLTALMIRSILYVGIVLLSSSLIFKIDFNDSFLPLVGILALLTFSINALVLALGYMFGNITIIRPLFLGAVFVAAFFGGVYEPYTMQTETFIQLMDKSPIYYIVRSSVEIVTKGSSAYTGTALAILLTTAVISIGLGLVFYVKKEGTRV